MNSDVTGDRPAANATAAAIAARLPRRPLLSATDVAAALGLATTAFVVAAIESGGIAAVRVGSQYRIARAEAERWIAGLGVAK